jgi:hypothetical protein
MRLHTLSITATLLASTVAFAQAQVPPGSEGAATAGSGASNAMSNQPPGTTQGSGTPATGADSGTMQPADMTGTPSPSGKTMKKHTDYSSFPDDNANSDDGGASDGTHSDNGAMTGGNPAGRDDSNRGSSPDGGTNGVTPH